MAAAVLSKGTGSPHDVVKPGQVVTVNVQDVDLNRRRISLTMHHEEDTLRLPHLISGNTPRELSRRDLRLRISR